MTSFLRAANTSLMDGMIAYLIGMCVVALAFFAISTFCGWRLLRWSRRRPERRRALGLVLTAVLAGFCIFMIMARWDFSYSQTVNGVGTNIHVQLGWLFLLPLGFTVAAVAFWIKARGNPPPSTTAAVPPGEPAVIRSSPQDACAPCQNAPLQPPLAGPAEDGSVSR